MKKEVGKCHCSITISFFAKRIYFMLSRDMQENVSLQREKCEDMRRKLERSEERLADRAALQVKCQQLQEQLAQWSATDNTGKRRPM